MEENNKQNEKDYVTIPYFAHEADMARSERNSKRQWIAIIVLIISLLASNIAWIIYESQFVEVSSNEEYDIEQYSNNDSENKLYISKGDISNGNNN